MINTVKSSLFQLQLPAESQNLYIIRKFILGIAKNMRVSEEDTFQIELMVDEACSNIVKHAYKNISLPEEIIQITIKKNAESIEIMIVDRGIGFDPNAIKSPDIGKHAKRVRPGGLGLHLIKTLSDELYFRINPQVHNEVKIIKFLKHQSTGDV
jgi:serine/threonine-protein kinase RsbW